MYQVIIDSRNKPDWFVKLIEEFNGPIDEGITNIFKIKTVWERELGNGDGAWTMNFESENHFLMFLLMWG